MKGQYDISELHDLMGNAGTYGVDDVLRWAVIETWEANGVELGPVATSMKDAERMSQLMHQMAPRLWSSAVGVSALSGTVRDLWDAISETYDWPKHTNEARLKFPTGAWPEADFERFRDAIDHWTAKDWGLAHARAKVYSKSSLTPAVLRKWDALIAKTVAVIGERVKVEALGTNYVYGITQGTGAGAKTSSITNNDQLPELREIQPSEHAIGLGFGIVGDTTRAGSKQAIRVTNTLTDRVLVLTSDAQTPVKVELRKGEVHTLTMAALKHTWTFSVYEPKATT